MNVLRRVVLAVWEFVVGDDPLTALGVVVALSLTAILAHAGTPAWWVLPVAALLLLARAVFAASRR